MSKKNIKTLVQLIIFLSLGIGLVIWRYNAISAEDKMAMFEAFKSVKWLWLIPIFIVGFLSHYFRALRWKQLLKPLNIFPKTANTLFAVLIGYLGNTVIPRFGEVAKCTVLAKYEKVPVDKLIGTIIAERAFDLISLVIILLLTLSLQYSIIQPIAAELYFKLLTDSSGNFNWLIVLAGFVLLLVGIYFLIRISRNPQNSKIGKIIMGITDGLKSIALVEKKGIFLLNSLMIWVMYTTMAVFGFWAMSGTENLGLFAGLAVITFGSVGMIATPGGIGAYPVIVAQLLILYGISEGIGLAYGWVSWAAQTFVVIILGIASLILLPIYNRKRDEHEKRTSTP